MDDQKADNQKKSPEQKEENEFKTTYEQWGGKIFGKYRNKNIPVDCICPKGHISKIKPQTVFNGRSACEFCDQTNYYTEHGKQLFYNVMRQIPQITLTTKYVDNNTPVGIICPYGHYSTIYPMSIIQLNYGRYSCDVREFCDVCQLAVHDEKIKEYQKIKEQLDYEYYGYTFNPFYKLAVVFGLFSLIGCIKLNQT